MPPPLKPCKDCGASVSKNAPSCPQCGAVLKRKSGCLGSLFAILLLILFVPVFVSLLSNHSGSTSPGERNTRSTSSVPPTGAAAGQNAPPELYIPGIAGIDVYGNLKDRGFSVKRDIGKNSVFWTCENSSPIASYRVDVTARTPSEVMFVSGTLLYSGDKKADPFAHPFFGYLATLPYTGSNPEEARKWVEMNIGNIGAKTSFGDVEFLISGNDRSRILQLRNKNAAPFSAPATSSSIPTAPAKVPDQPANWRFDHSDYEMSKGRIHHAATTSSNTVNFGFPYGGAQRGTLFLRTHPKYGKDVVLSIERGQFLVRSYEDSKALVRFDDGDPITYTVVGAEDHSTTSVFFRDYQGFVSKMLKAKRVRISVPVYQQGSPVFEFDVSGFDSRSYLEQNDKG